MIPEQQYSAIIVAGGKGLRAGGDQPKQFHLLGDKPMLMHTIQAFYRASNRIRIIVVLPQGFDEYWRTLCRRYNFTIDHTLVEGGPTRFHSVQNGLQEVADEDTVAIHDAARPFVSPQLINSAFHRAFTLGCGVIPATVEKNSIRIIQGDSSRSVDRDLVKIIQTPQVFPAGELKRAYQTDYLPSFTDDASVAEAFGMEIALIEGEDSNIKITTPFDLEIAHVYWNNYLNSKID